MSILTTSIPSTNVDTLAYQSTNNSAITIMSLCNTAVTDAIVSIHVVPTGSIADDSNIIIKDLVIQAADTFVLYQGSEKIILSDQDSISVKSTSTVTSLVSFVGI